jgi:hypothetical protein
VGTAADEGIDLIVIAAHGLTGWRRFMFGSVAEKVVRLAQCPVLSIRGPEGEQGNTRTVSDRANISSSELLRLFRKMRRSPFDIKQSTSFNALSEPLLAVVAVNPFIIFPEILFGDDPLMSNVFPILLAHTIPAFHAPVFQVNTQDVRVRI